MSDDWDDEASSGFSGGAIGRGFGRGRGSSDTNNNFGKSGSGPQMNGDAAGDSNGFGSKRAGFGGGRGVASSGDSKSGFGTSGGFGSGGGGFASKKADDDWDEGGTSESKGGFGKRGGGGGGRGGGFGSRNNDSDDVPRGGGFGGQKKGGCFKCGEEGHMSRECPNGGGGGGSGGGNRACFKCGEEGHMSRECPKGGGGGGRGCFKCGEEGHMSRECPSGGGGGGNRACFKCGEEGHMSRECPKAGGGGSKGCFKCGEEGHMARECPSAGGSSGGGGGFGARSGGFGGSGGEKTNSGGFGGGGGSSGGKGCFKCGEEGHMSRECPSGGGGKGCFKCGEEGHMSRECPTGGGNKGCFKCKEEGHMARDCPNAEASGADGDKPREIYVPPPPPEGEDEIFQTIQKGINFDRYDEISVECTGDGAIKTGLSSFDQADLQENILNNVRKAKYDKPTPVQKFAIPIILGGRDLMACAQTGSGKTAAFLLPVLTKMMQNGLEGSQFSEQQEPQALIVGPTRELVNQIFNEARKFSYNTMLRPVVVYGGTSVGHQLRQIENGAHMVVGTPGRLLDFIGRGKIGLKKVKFLILDEADRMLDMGFEPEIRKLVDTLGLPSKEERQTLMFSATFPEQIQTLAKDFLNNYLFVTVGRVGGANTDITQTIHEVTQFEKREKLIGILNETGKDRTLVFVELKRQADFLASLLSQSDFPTTSIHGDRLQREREEALRDFKTGRAPILVATSVAARGLDIPGVQHVINYDMPKEVDEYVHRIGRTGRCGNTGKATSFFDPAENGSIARPLVKILQDAQQVVPDWLEEAAQSSYGTGGFTDVGGKYGGRDTRRGKFNDGGATENGFGGGSSGGFGGGSSGGGGAEEESWD